MAGDGVLLVARDRVVAHAGEIIVGMIVLAHVLEAEAPVFALAQPPLRRAVRRLAGAARPLANRQRRRAACASCSGLTRIRLNRGESSFMTDHYADAAAHPQA